MISSSGSTLVVPPQGTRWRDVYVLENCSLEWSSPVLAEVGVERDRQEEIGYDAAHDDEHTPLHTLMEAYHRLGRADMRDKMKARADLVKVASLIVATIETIDREEARDVQG